MNGRWSAVVLGALICLPVSAILFLFGSSIGLFVSPIERLSGAWSWQGLAIGSGVFIIATTALSFLMGGYFATQLAHLNQKWEVRLVAMSTWAVGSSAMLLMVVGAAAMIFPTAEKGGGALVLLEALNRSHPRIVTDFSMFKGKAVTSIDIGVTPKKLVNATRNAVKDEEGSLETARDAGLAVSLVGLLSLIASAIGTAVGSVIGYHGLTRRERHGRYFKAA